MTEDVVIDAPEEVEVELTAREELEEIAEVLREADEAEKEAKALKDEVKGPFFELISEVVRDEVALARETIIYEIKADDVNAYDTEIWRKRNYPLHNIVAIQPESDEEDGPATRLLITIEESDEFKKYEFVVGGYKFGRTVRMDGKGFDAERFLADTKANEELEAKIKKALLATVKSERVTVTTYTFDEAKATALMAEHPKTVTYFQEYINPGTPKLALLPIKEAKDDA